MTRTAMAGIAFAGGILFGAGAIYLSRPKPAEHWPNEHALIVLTERDGTCKVRERRPQDIYTQSKSTVTWIIVNSCANAPAVAIDRMVHLKAGGTQDIFEPGNLTRPGQDGNRIVGTLKDGLATGKDAVGFEYTILINGRPAEHASPADRGNLYACPSWPCRREAF